MSRKHVSCITINTDASFQPELKVGGYAFHIVCNSFRIKKSGEFKENCSSSMDAEMKCIANALHTLLKIENLPTTNWLIINTDCLGCFNWVKLKSKNPIGKLIAQLIKKIRARCGKNGKLPKYQLRHVKAHTTNKDARSMVNKWCDNEAKKHMRNKVKKLVCI